MYSYIFCLLLQSRRGIILWFLSFNRSLMDKLQGSHNSPHIVLHCLSPIPYISKFLMTRNEYIILYHHIKMLTLRAELKSSMSDSHCLVCLVYFAVWLASLRDSLSSSFCRVNTSDTLLLVCSVYSPLHIDKWTFTLH